VLKRVKATDPFVTHEDGTLEVWDPDGHSFFVRGGTANHPIKKITLNTMDLCKTKGLIIIIGNLTLIFQNIGHGLE
jgi:hypothetical protein